MIANFVVINAPSKLCACATFLHRGCAEEIICLITDLRKGIHEQ